MDFTFPLIIIQKKIILPVYLLESTLYVYKRSHIF